MESYDRFLNKTWTLLGRRGGLRRYFGELNVKKKLIMWPLISFMLHMLTFNARQTQQNVYKTYHKILKTIQYCDVRPGQSNADDDMQFLLHKLLTVPCTVFFQSPQHQLSSQNSDWLHKCHRPHKQTQDFWDELLWTPILTRRKAFGILSWSHIDWICRWTWKIIASCWSTKWSVVRGTTWWPEVMPVTGMKKKLRWMVQHFHMQVFTKENDQEQKHYTFDHKIDKLFSEKMLWVTMGSNFIWALFYMVKTTFCWHLQWQWFPNNVIHTFI